jgi:glycerol uptake facilitator-like aquaporin
MSVARRASAEALGTAFLLAAVIGSGIMGERLAAGNENLALLANSLATGFALIALILAFGPHSGAHLNPLVTLALALRGEFAKREVAGYVVAQLLGALAGMFAAHAMFDLPLVQVSDKVRTGAAQWWSEIVATFGLVFIVVSCVRERQQAVSFAVGAYIAAAYWFTASTSFANPAVTVARAATDTFTGIRPLDVPAFIVAQVIGAALAVAFGHWLDRQASGAPTPGPSEPPRRGARRETGR